MLHGVLYSSLTLQVHVWHPHSFVERHICTGHVHDAKQQDYAHRGFNCTEFIMTYSYRSMYHTWSNYITSGVGKLTTTARVSSPALRTMTLIKCGRVCAAGVAAL